ncbi:MAG: phytanoyl-CoA dioxygenase family protein [Pseudomonadota bacterium]
MTLTADELSVWRAKGWLLLPGYLEDPHSIRDWVDDLAARPETPGKWMKYFEPGAEDERQLCRVENFLEHHKAFAALVTGGALLEVLGQLLEEPAILFKEKINFKLPGGAGFEAHQDAPAFTAFGQTLHITAMLSVDATTPENGCLELAPHPGSARILPLAPDLTIEASVADALDWTAIPTQPGDLLLFDAFLPHRSGANRSAEARRALYLTYAKAAEGDHRLAYYAKKRAAFPPDVEREPGRDYGPGGVFNVGNPIR